MRRRRIWVTKVLLIVVLTCVCMFAACNNVDELIQYLGTDSSARVADSGTSKTDSSAIISASNSKFDQSGHPKTYSTGKGGDPSKPGEEPGNKPSTNQLNKPVLSRSGLNVIWSSVSGATFYKVYLNGEHFTTVTALSIIITGSDFIGKTIQVQACCDDAERNSALSDGIVANIL